VDIIYYIAPSMRYNGILLQISEPSQIVLRLLSIIQIEMWPSSLSLIKAEWKNTRECSRKWKKAVLFIGGYPRLATEGTKRAPRCLRFGVDLKGQAVEGPWPGQVSRCVSLVDLKNPHGGAYLSNSSIGRSLKPDGLIPHLCALPAFFHPRVL